MRRREFLAAAMALGLSTSSASRRSLASEAVSSTTKSAGQAHAEIWRRFIDRHGVFLDFTDLDGSVELPTPAECQSGKPNALGWWSPIENGPMFNGMYLDAAVLRWQRSRADEDAAKVRRLVAGLLLLNSVSDVKGFIARGVSTDGKSHYAMGSNDQTLPWFYGLWRFLESGLATAEERTTIVARLVETAEVLVSLGWAMPAEPPFQRRGSFAAFEFDNAPRLLFVCRLLSEVTGETRWEHLYRQALAERGGKDNLSRLEICRRGMQFHYAPYHSWTSCSSVAVLRSMWELEQDETTKSAFGQGLQASADLALKSLPLAAKFDHQDATTFDADWRMMNAFWQPQQTQAEAEEVAHRELREFLKVSPRRARETAFVREPTAAAWVVTLAPDNDALQQRTAAVESVIRHYDYSRLYYSQFFWVECAWQRLQGI